MRLCRCVWKSTTGTVSAAARSGVAMGVTGRRRGESARTFHAAAAAAATVTGPAANRNCLRENMTEGCRRTGSGSTPSSTARCIYLENSASSTPPPSTLRCINDVGGRPMNAACRRRGAPHIQTVAEVQPRCPCVLPDAQPGSRARERNRASPVVPSGLSVFPIDDLADRPGEAASARN
jgi:hypothetical protein